MTRLFVYTDSFLRSWEALGLNDDQLQILEERLLLFPKCGDVIEGTGGVRKLRIRLENNRGKSGGGRVIYIDIAEADKIYMLFAYPKNVQDDLSEQQKKSIKKLVEKIKSEGNKNGRD